MHAPTVVQSRELLSRMYCPGTKNNWNCSPVMHLHSQVVLQPGPGGSGTLAGASLSLEGSHGTLGPLQLPPQPTDTALVLQHGNVGHVRSLTVTGIAALTMDDVQIGALLHAVVTDDSSLSLDAVHSHPPKFVCRACLAGTPHTRHWLERLRPGSEAAYQLRLTVTRGPAPPSDVALQVLLMGTRGGGGVQRCVVPKRATVRCCGYVEPAPAKTTMNGPCGCANPNIPKLVISQSPKPLHYVSTPPYSLCV